MKQTIYYKYEEEFGLQGIEPTQHGDWIDLYMQNTFIVNAGHDKGGVHMINLGIAIKLPKGYEAHMVLRSSTPSKKNIMMANSIGIIDNEYCGNEDYWKIPAIIIDKNINTVIDRSERVCQFKVVLSQRATVWQKIKWIFTSGFELERVRKLDDKNRGGIGSTGK